MSVEDAPKLSKSKKKSVSKKKRVKKKTGPRPRYKNPEVIAIILKSKGLGMSNARAFEAADIGRSTMDKWRTMSEDDDNPPPELVNLFKEVKFADSKAQQRALGIVWEVAEQKRNWKAAIKLLERIWPREFGPPLREDPGKEHPVQVIVNLPDNGRNKNK